MFLPSKLSYRGVVCTPYTCHASCQFCRQRASSGRWRARFQPPACRILPAFVTC